MAHAVCKEGEAGQDEHDGETLDDLRAGVAHESPSAMPFSVTTFTAHACNASMASTKVVPHASSQPMPDLTRGLPACSEAVLRDAKASDFRRLMVPSPPEW